MDVIDADEIVDCILLHADVRTLHRVQRVSRQWMRRGREVFSSEHWRKRQLLDRTWIGDFAEFPLVPAAEPEQEAGGSSEFEVAAVPSSWVRTTANGSGAYPPAGSNTTATVSASFTSAAVHITVCETEITSADEDSDWDEYEECAAWDALYTGTVSWSTVPAGPRGIEGPGVWHVLVRVGATMRKGETFCYMHAPHSRSRPHFVATLIFPSYLTRLLFYETPGHFDRGAEAEPAEIVCSLHPGGALRMEVPFAAGGCNEGTAGVQPVALRRCVDHRQVRAAADSGRESLPLDGLGIGQTTVHSAIFGIHTAGSEL